MADQSAPDMDKSYLWCYSEICHKFCFLNHTFRTRNAKRQSRALKTRIIAKFPTKTLIKIGLMGRHPGTEDLGQK